MTIKLSDYIKNPDSAISNEEWHMLYELAYKDSNDEELAEELVSVSMEMDELLE